MLRGCSENLSSKKRSRYTAVLAVIGTIRLEVTGHCSSVPAAEQKVCDIAVVADISSRDIIFPSTLSRRGRRPWTVGLAALSGVGAAF